jgi:NAD(P)-dependent dehydrogenase (short-subunit alcohol dehydrogenase family)
MGVLDGHRAVVTGGGSGIGRATCRRMAEEGAQVAVFDVDGDSAETVAKEIDGIAYAVDVTDAEAVQRAVDDAAREMGGLSVLYNNAGIGFLAHIHEFPLEEWHRIIDVNLHGVFHGFRAAVPHMLRGGDGRIVSTASISGTRPSAGEAPYSMAKIAVAALTANAALEYGPTIRVNAVSPGMIRTKLTEPLLDGFPDLQPRYIADTPVARIGEPEDIADVVVFLCSDASRFMTGQNLVVDGGMTLHGAGVDHVLEHIKALMAGGASA